MERTLFQMHAEAAYIKQLMDIKNTLTAQSEAIHHKYDKQDVIRMNSEAYNDFWTYGNEIERAQGHGVDMANTKLIATINELIEKNRVFNLQKEGK